MIVALDAQLALGTATGIGEYVTGLGAALRAAGVDVVALDEPKLDPWRFDRRVMWDQVLLPQRAQSSGADLLHCASGTMPLRLPMPAVVTVHDVAWLKVQRHTRPYARYYFGTFALQRYARAAAIVVDSAFSRSELLGVFDADPDRVHVAYPGVARDFCSVERCPAEEPFALIPGTVERRKNLEVVIRALARIPRLRVVSVGPWTPYREECLALAKDLGVDDRVELRGYVDRRDLLDLYARCTFVAMPSRYEGFGYPAAQALCAGAPVLISDAASLVEIAAGDAAGIASAGDDDAWARECDRLLAGRDAAERGASAVRERALGRFSWAACAQNMREVYAAALQGTADSRR